ncbi:class I SAM-dependent methyltransferase [Stackebrandtia nassauensis]|uniref:Methyltransferase domain-containing protein n=1 Tax=Stackebrandtia nassauensis (strain DSM 44728 / CIP 108903 / NRRL B-16338 / NBRC 102104 / LLR-40K-21) TaxID=446470 RepID=D3Q1C0_STANL|nr:class I SAM-dependent methyltransferase [Stackebrandtia nassauensis]ADD45700.1 hypothetical protein Snas_6076 [Stackebrandtia nassauensis DSM 44728]
MNAQAGGETDLYADALGHYRSPDRGDAVKVDWERPDYVGLLRVALRHVRAGRRGIRVVDLGAGAGEGWWLTRAALGRGVHFGYTAVDSSPSLLALGERRLGGEAGVRFRLTDMRDFDFAADPTDVYLSVGAPFSELDEESFAEVVRGIGMAVASRRGPSAVVLDVYGRDCLSWIPVAADRRTYSMTFFLDAASPPTRDMRFYTRGRLERVIHNGLTDAARNRLTGLVFSDRCVFSSRHTLTGAYNPDVPRLRTAVNALINGEDVPDGDRGLVIPEKAYLPHLGATPSHRALARTVDTWNKTVHTGLLGGRRSLARSLRGLNQITGTAAAGIGHYLTVVALFAAG